MNKKMTHVEFITYLKKVGINVLKITRKYIYIEKHTKDTTVINGTLIVLDWTYVEYNITYTLRHCLDDLRGTIPAVRIIKFHTGLSLKESLDIVKQLKMQV
jgi:hypothetical protein